MVSKQLIMSRVETELGAVLICSTEAGICLLEFEENNNRFSERKRLEMQVHHEAKIGTNQHIELAIEELSQYFLGQKKHFSVNVDLIGTEFQKQVWHCLKQIPYGETWSYKKQAEHIGRPKAVRAVAGANGKNKIAIIIPCHRVIGANQSLTGYAGGIARKKSLLDLEMNNRVY